MKKVIIDDQVVPLSETKTVISFSAPTPKWMSTLFNIVLVAATLVTTGVVSFFSNYMNTETQLLIVSICAYTTFAVRFITKAFGLEVKE